MAYSNKEWLNQFKSTNNNINEINNKMLSTIENYEKENINLKKALNEFSVDNQQKDKTIQNSNKIITSLKTEYDLLSKEYNDIEKYVVDLEEENKGYKNLLDEITKSHDIHKTLILQNENLKNKQIKKKTKIEDLRKQIANKDAELKEISKELTDKNNIIEDFQAKFEDFEKLLEKKEILLNTAELSNTELKARIKGFERENKELLKRLNEEFFNKKLDFEEIIKQSVEALKIFYAKFEANINNNLNEQVYFDIPNDNIYESNSGNMNNNNNPNANFNNSNSNPYYYNVDKSLIDKSNLANNKNTADYLKTKTLKSAYNTVALEDVDLDAKSSNSKYDRFNRSLSPIGKRDNYSTNFLSKSNNRREKFSKTNFQKRSKSSTKEKRSQLNLQNLNFLKNEIFNFKEFFDLYNSEQLNLNRENKDFKKATASNNFGSSIKDNNKNLRSKNISNLNKINSSLDDYNNNYIEESNNRLKYPLKIIVEQSLLNPINYKINQKNILRGNLQAFNFYYNFLKSELFSSLLRESNTANFIKAKLTPILREYAEDGNQNPLKNLSENLENMQKNLMQNLANIINDVKNKLDNELDSKNVLLQEIKNLQAEKQKLNDQLEELESNLDNLSAIYDKNFDKLVEKINSYKAEKDSLEHEIGLLNDEIIKIKIKHEKLLESFNDLKDKYATALRENEEINKELVDVKKRLQQKNESNSIHNNNNNIQGVYITTEENFSFKGYSRSENNYNDDVYSDYNNKDMQLMKENMFLKQENKKLQIEKDNLKYHLSRIEQGLDKANYENINLIKPNFNNNNLFVRRAAEVFYLPMLTSNTFFHNRLNTNTFDYTNNNNNSNNIMFTSLDYNNFLLREDENNKKIYGLELEISKLNNQISQLLEKNQALEYKNNKLLQKTLRFSTRLLSIHNNIRFNIERSEEYIFKKQLLEKDEEVTFKYNVPTINYNSNCSNSEKDENSNQEKNAKLKERENELNLIYNYNATNTNNSQEIGFCETCRIQYQEVKAFRKAIKTATYKELKTFYMNLTNDFNKITTKLDNILENFNKTTACFESDFDISNANSNHFPSGSLGNPLYNVNNINNHNNMNVINSSNITQSLNRTIRVSQVKEILNTFSKMILVLSNTIKKYQKDLTLHTSNMEKIFEFVYRIVFSTLVYNEKFRAKMRESKSLNSNASIKSKFAALDDNCNNSAIALYKKNFLSKLDDYWNNFGKIQGCLFFEEDLDMNRKRNDEILMLRGAYANKAFGDVIDSFKRNADEVLKEFAAKDFKFKDGSIKRANDGFHSGEGDSNNNTHEDLMGSLNFKNSRNNSSQKSYSNDANVGYADDANSKNDKEVSALKTDTFRNNRFIDQGSDNQRSDSSNSNLDKLKVLENIINPGKYNFEYSAKDELNSASKKNELMNKIPSGKSRSHSKDHHFKNTNKFDTDKNSAKTNDLIKTNFKDISEKSENTMFCLIIKHYLCANEALISYIAEEMRTNVSNNKSTNLDNVKYTLDAMSSLFEILEDASNKILVYVDDKNYSFLTMRNLILNLIFIFKNSFSDLFEF